MIDNFDEVKRQLKELSTVINSYKSEAVQLRIMEIILSGSEIAIDEQGEANGDTPPIKKRKRKSKKIQGKGDNPDSKSQGKRKPSGSGAIATLVSIYEEGYFSKQRAIKDIVEHCETNLARKIKSTDISGKLGRMVRNGELTRTKNSDGQYEYKNA